MKRIGIVILAQVGVRRPVVPALAPSVQCMRFGRPPSCNALGKLVQSLQPSCLTIDVTVLGPALMNTTHNASAASVYAPQNVATSFHPAALWQWHPFPPIGLSVGAE